MNLILNYIYETKIIYKDINNDLYKKVYDRDAVQGENGTKPRVYQMMDKLNSLLLQNNLDLQE